MGKTVIYSNEFYEKDDKGKCAEDYAREYLLEEHGADNGWKTVDDIPNEEVYRELDAEDTINWSDFELELESFIDSHGSLLCVGTCGRWNGTYEGGRYIDGMRDLLKVLTDCDYITIYDEDGRLFLEAHHHDGSIYAEMRRLTKLGQAYREAHYWDNDRDVHRTIFNSNFLSGHPNYAEIVYGVKPSRKRKMKKVNETKQAA